LKGEKVFRARRCPGIQQRGWRAAEDIQVRVMVAVLKSHGVALRWAQVELQGPLG
jgi:hypothetical protein